MTHHDGSESFKQLASERLRKNISWIVLGRNVNNFDDLFAAFLLNMVELHSNSLVAQLEIVLIYLPI